MIKNEGVRKAGDTVTRGAFDLIYVADRTTESCNECFFNYSPGCTKVECFSGLHLEEVSVSKQRVITAALRAIAEDFKSSESYDFGAGAYCVGFEGLEYHIQISKIS